MAAFAGDLDNTTRWYQNIKSVDWETPRPLAVGSRVAFVAEFLGRRLSYTCNRGEPAGFKQLVAPVLARAMRRANQKDLLQGTVPAVNSALQRAATGSLASRTPERWHGSTADLGARRSHRHG